MREAVKEKKPNKFLAEALTYLGVFLLTCVLFALVKPLVEPEGTRMGVVPQSLIVITITVCLFIGGYFALNKTLTYKRAMILLLVIGYALRVGYMLYTSAATRQHDTYTKNFDGHEAYAWTLFTTGKLPTTNDYQFYHPPLNAMVQAAFMHIVDGFTSLFSGSYFPNAFTHSMPSYIEPRRFFLYYLLH